MLRPSQILDTPWHFRFRTDADSPFHPVFPKLIGIKRHSGTGPWSAFLKHSDEVVCIERAVRIGNEFTLYAAFYIDAAPVDRVLARRREIVGVNLRRELNLDIVRMGIDLRVETHRGRVHPVLKLKEGTSVLMIQTRAYAQTANQNYIQMMTVPPTPEWLHISDYGVDASGI